jgi:hypothetical protein
MSDSNYKEQLLSAYLDDELKPDERAQVEKLLANEPGSRLRVQQWKEQGDFLRSLPRLELNKNLSQRVLQTIKDRSLQPQAVLSRPADMVGELIHRPDEWDDKKQIDRKSELDVEGTFRRTRRRRMLAAIGTLAGMILLGVLINHPPALVRQIAQPRDGANGKAVPEAIGSLAMPSAEERGENSELHASQFDPSSATESSSAIAENMPGSLARSQEGAGGMEANEDFAVLTESRFRNQHPPKDALLDTLDHRNSAPQGELRTVAPQGDPLPMPLAGLAREVADEGTSALQEPGSGANRPSALERSAAEQAYFQPPPPLSVPQIFIVDFPADEHPLAVISEVFSRNQIEIFTDQPSAQLPLPISPPRSGLLRQQSSKGVEVIYVIASRTQLRNAMDELSSWADISGYQVNSEMLAKALTPAVENQPPREHVVNMDDLIAEAAYQLSIPFRKRAPAEQESSAQPDSPPVALVARPKQSLAGRAMAQQLPPIERNSHGKQSSAASAGAQPNQGKKEGASNQQDSLDRMMYSRTMDLSWNYSPDRNRAEKLQADDRHPPSASDKADNEMVQFLLLVRNQAKPDPNPVPQAEPSKE